VWAKKSALAEYDMLLRRFKVVFVVLILLKYSTEGGGVVYGNL
jgi:hypothetical protein